MANSPGRHKSVTEGNAWFKGVDSVNYALREAAQEFLIANIKLQTEKLWRVRYSMYLDRRAAVALVPISVSVIKTSTCCSCCELSGCVCVCAGRHRRLPGPVATDKTVFISASGFTFCHISHVLYRVVTLLHDPVSRCFPFSLIDGTLPAFLSVRASKFKVSHIQSVMLKEADAD